MERPILRQENAGRTTIVRTHPLTDEQTKALLRRQLTVQEDERRRVSRDLHDHLGQQLTALRMNLEVFRLQSGLDPSRLEQLVRTQHLADELDRSVDFLIWQLRPASLDHRGLSEALRELTANWSERLGFTIHFRSTLNEEYRLQREVEENLYRIVQEALNNVLKHAQSAHVSVSLFHEDGLLSLRVEDDGCGFDDRVLRSDASHNLGLIGMRERAALIDGEIDLATGVGRGTSISVRVHCPV